MTCCYATIAGLCFSRNSNPLQWRGLQPLLVFWMTVSCTLLINWSVNLVGSVQLPPSSGFHPLLGSAPSYVGMAICSNDAKSCFDRMFHSMTYICCMRRLGIPKCPLLSMFQVIQKTQPPSPHCIWHLRQHLWSAFTCPCPSESRHSPRQRCSYARLGSCQLSHCEHNTVG
jgi:hypothetical protein